MLKQSIKSFSILAFLFVISGVNAQIEYTDINPDVTVSEFQQGYGVDFNNDDKVDVHVTLLSNTGVWVMHLIPDSSVDNTFVVYDGEETSILELEDEIAPTSNLYKLGEGWGGLLYGYWSDSGEYGNWIGTQEDKYIGVKFEIGSDFYYGWIHLTTHQYSLTDFDFTIKGFAYNTAANEPILAGDKGTGMQLDKLTFETISVFPNPSSDYVYIKNIENIEEVKIIDSSGKIQKELIFNKNSNSINITTLKNGIYWISFETQNKKFTKRIIKN